MSTIDRALVDALQYQFNDKELLKVALTHRSASNKNNERLEFLGDSVLGFVITETLFTQFPEASEGDLSRLRANLVNRQSLAVFARSMQLGDYLTLGAGELKSGGFRRESILADTMEAIMGAILLDSSFDQCRKSILFLYEERLAHMPSVDEIKDPKTRLQEYLQGHKYDLPSYEVLSVTGKSHNQQFIVQCQVVVLGKDTKGTGGSRRKAEQQAAVEMLSLLKVKTGA
ncbi:MAG: ribonuclease III [Gammaproteobacteria bacterium]